MVNSLHSHGVNHHTAGIANGAAAKRDRHVSQSDIPMMHAGRQREIWTILAGYAVFGATTGCHSGTALPFDYPATQVETLQVGGTLRRYDLHVPTKRRGSGPMPLVLVLHGQGATGRDMEASTEFSALSDREGFLVAYPYALGTPSTWDLGRDTIGNQSSDTAFIRLLLDTLSRQYRVDQRRIFIAGHSNGGMMAYVAGGALSDRIAGIGVSAGTAGRITDDGMTFHVARRHSAVSAIIFHGAADQTVPYEGVVHLNGGERSLMSAPQSATFWAQSDGCDSVPSQQTLPGGNVRVATYHGCRTGSAVVLYTINDGIHRWPGGITDDVPATSLMWAFWKDHPKPKREN